MTEMRWVTRRNVSEITGAVFLIQKILQYRNFINNSWTEWQDVPIVEEENDYR
jgi:hypothetical protein